ncbi:MAG: hypothetical protein Q9222_000624 [Ikaeria aurantiellina]
MAPQPLEVLVIGAGIGGLSCALGLRKNGHHVKVYERSDPGTELGAAVILAPNAHGLIKRLGIDAEKDGAVPRHEHTEYTASGVLLDRVDLNHAADLWEHRGVLCHRAAIHHTLKHALLLPNDAEPAAELHYSSNIIDVDPEAAKVLFADGTSRKADLLIGADGIKVTLTRFLSQRRTDTWESMTRAQVNDSKPFPSGKSAYRFLVDRQKTLNNEIIGDITERTGEFSIWYGQDRRIWMYTTQRNELLNLVCMHPDVLSEVKNSQEQFGDSNDDRDHKRHMLEIFKDFDKRILELLRLAEPSSVRLWRLWDMDPPSHRCSGRLGLIGDAALPFLPHIGQGAACAIEDAASITAIFPNGTGRQEVPARLRLYEETRKGRSDEIHSFSRSLGSDLEAGNEDARVNRALMAKKYFPYIFGHDEYAHSAERLSCWLRG